MCAYVCAWVLERSGVHMCMCLCVLGYVLRSMHAQMFGVGVHTCNWVCAHVSAHTGVWGVRSMVGHMGGGGLSITSHTFETR